MTRILTIGTTAMAVLLWSLALAASPAQLPFPVTQAEVRQMARRQVFDGVLEAVNKATVAAQTTGRIVEIDADVDDYVPKGQVIIRFRDTEQKAALKRAQAGLDEASARYKQSKDEYERRKNLFAKQLISKAAMDAASADYKSAQARLAGAQGAVTAAQEQLDHTVVRAPYSGIVTARHVEVGETATVGQPLMTGISLEELRASVDIPQEYVDTLRHDADILVTLPDGRVVKGESLRVFPYADPQAHTFKVRVNLKPGEKGVYPGMLIKVSLVTGEVQRLVVPVQAVIHRSEVTGVYVVGDDGAVHLRQVRIGHEYEGGEVEVLSGLSAGETVALDPQAATVYTKNQPGD